MFRQRNIVVNILVWEKTALGEWRIGTQTFSKIEDVIRKIQSLSFITRQLHCKESPCVEITPSRFSTFLSEIWYRILELWAKSFEFDVWYFNQKLLVISHFQPHRLLKQPALFRATNKFNKQIVNKVNKLQNDATKILGNNPLHGYPTCRPPGYITRSAATLVNSIHTVKSRNNKSG
jgi:hypothetical protein